MKIRQPNPIPESTMDGSQTISYSLGTIFGRWDIRFAIGKLTVPPLPDPFAPLPTCAPGMLVDNDRLPASEPPKDYPFEVAWDGVVPDDPSSPHDILVRVRTVLERIWTKEPRKSNRCLPLFRNKGIARVFPQSNEGRFRDEHVSRYTANRRKAPIYWLLQSSKKNYCLWLYYHRLDKDLLFKALVNYVEPKIRLESSRSIPFAANKPHSGPSGKEAKRLAKEVEHQEDFLS